MGKLGSDGGTPTPDEDDPNRSAAIVSSALPPRELFHRKGERLAGVLPPKRVRLMCFGVLSLGLLSAGFVCILAVWGAAPQDVAWKSVATLGIVALVMIAFTILNEKFGSLTAA